MGLIRKLNYHIGVDWDGRSGVEVNLREDYALKLDMPTIFGGSGKHPCPNELFFFSWGCSSTKHLIFITIKTSK